LPVTGGGAAADALGDIVLCMAQLQLSARAYHRTRSVKLSRASADLAGCADIQPAHLAEGAAILSEVDEPIVGDDTSIAENICDALIGTGRSNYNRDRDYTFGRGFVRSSLSPNLLINNIELDRRVSPSWKQD
jgi:hypothetical protein